MLNRENKGKGATTGGERRMRASFVQRQNECVGPRREARRAGKGAARKQGSKQVEKKQGEGRRWICKGK